MGCGSCGTNGGGCSTGGCSGGCSSGGCNRLNTYDWLAKLQIKALQEYPYIEVGFNHGSHKHFFQLPPNLDVITGDLVVVNTGSGYDVGRVTLTAELARIRRKKKKYSKETILQPVVRIAHEKDIERMMEARAMSKESLIKARAISRTLDLDMKIAEVEYQADLKKAIFYFIAEGRVDFRELIKEYARVFRVKIEMKQIGSRQESGLVGGIGSCGRELCCSTWLTDFKSISTAAARYQNLAINQTKLSGQCGRLKCCLNFELDTYIDALQDFPVDADRIFHVNGHANLVKTDVFKRLMTYSYEAEKGRISYINLDVDKVKEIQDRNTRGDRSVNLGDIKLAQIEKEPIIDFADVTGEIELPNLKKKKKKKNRNNNRQFSGLNIEGVRSNQQRPQTPQNPNRNQDRPTRPGDKSGNSQNQQGQNQQGQGNNPRNKQGQGNPNGPRPQHPPRQQSPNDNQNPQNNQKPNNTGNPPNQGGQPPQNKFRPNKFNNKFRPNNPNNPKNQKPPE
ncbi:MAG: hypothetical protein IPQ04_12740 [Saprospiraceae bacterium]|nr:hypothetical protein [Saprospiraceae bacterium]